MARRLAEDLVHGRLPPERVAEFVVLVSEIVSNAVRHGQPEDDGGIGLRLEVEDQGVMRAVVSDGAPAFVYSRKSATVGADHLGLFLVETLADRWGLSFGGRKAVWFEVDPTA